MMRLRFVPVLLLNEGGLYKTKNFKNPKYVGDPINAVKIFNEKEVDELSFLDIGAARKRSDPDFDMLTNIASECFMPLSYGGGVQSASQVRELLAIGIEKVVINTEAYRNPQLVGDLSERFGRSTVVCSIDIKKSFLGKNSVYISGGEEKIPISPLDWAIELERRGAGELLINSIDRDGTMAGFDEQLIATIAEKVSIPVVAAGGARSVEDLKNVIIRGGAAAAAAGSMFVFHGKHKAVLITYPSEADRLLITEKNIDI